MFYTSKYINSDKGYKVTELEGLILTYIEKRLFNKDIIIFALFFPELNMANWNL